MDKIDIGIKIIVGILLFVSGIIDIKTKKISLKLIIVCMIPLLFALPLRQEITIFQGILGMFLGIFILGIGKITKGQIGMGDGLILIATGMGLGPYNNIKVFMYGLFLAAVFSILLIAGKKIKGTTKIPFLPFLAMSYFFLLIHI